INGLLQQAAVSARELCYALLPIGTGNDWIRTHGIPRNWEQTLKMIQAGHTLLHDIGQVEYQTDTGSKKHYFINVAGMAYDAFLVRYIEEKNPKGLSKAYYFSMILRCLFMYRLKRARVWFDGQEEAAKFYTINVGVCKYSGGGMQFVPHADPTSGRLALTLVHAVSKLGVLLATPYFYEGRIRRHRKVTLHEVQEVRVEHVNPKEPVLVEVDGEFLGQTPVRYSLLPGALRVVVPKPLAD
ncbi:MAG: hypothetical protein KDC44_23630, partial [Phaeodactylibacter sp.]|nr:hypothetical protein [Phaeodactylibacter sp.]